MKEIQNKINESFTEKFGTTPLTERTQDILKQTYDLARFTDLKNLKAKSGDLLCSVIQLCNESGWDVEDVINQTLEKIEKRKLQYLSLGRKKNIAILGLSGNPVTLGHTQTAQFVLNASGYFDEVWLMPSYQSIFGKDLVTAEHRLNMCKLATNVDARIKVFDYEIKHELAGETFKLVKMLNNDPDYEQYEFAFIMGQDNANTFHKWVNYEHLEKMMKFVVIPRKGVERDLSIDWYLNKPHIFLHDEETNIMDVSSTLVRNLLKDIYENGYTSDKETELQKYLNKDVISYILKNNLYF